MSLIAFILVSSGLLTSSAGAEDRAQPIKIGVLTASWGPTPPVVGLRDGLLELGYRENEQFVLGVRFTQGDMAKPCPPPRVSWSNRGWTSSTLTSTYSAKAAQMATSRVPIVFAGVRDPLGLGLIQSFARPGGNITGVTYL